MVPGPVIQPDRGATRGTNQYRNSREQLALAIFDWIECWYNPKRRRSYCNMLSPIDYETATAA